MGNELSAAQREKLQIALGLARELLALPSVSKQDPSRFEAEVVLVAEGSGLDEVIAIIDKHIGEPVKSAAAPLLPEHAALAASFGGIRGGQTLYLHDVGDGLWLYVAFWPWSGGARITIKIGVREQG
jgi:hypothetical protein